MPWILSKALVTVTKRNMLNGLPKPKPKIQKPGVWKRQSNGWLKEKLKTGSILRSNQSMSKKSDENPILGGE